jgi:hypothetical protein
MYRLANSLVIYNEIRSQNTDHCPCQDIDTPQTQTLDQCIQSRRLQNDDSAKALPPAHGAALTMITISTNEAIPASTATVTCEGVP